MVKPITYTLLLLGIMLSCNRQPRAVEVVVDGPSYFGEPVYTGGDRWPMTDRTVALGNRLFFDPTLSVDSTVSCSSCHNQTAYFSDPGKALSTGMNDSLTVRNSPSLINLAWHTSFFREGGVRTLELSSIVPITHPNEIGRELTELTTALSKDPTYAEAFEKAFNEKQMSDGQLITALAHYMATLVYADSPYDLYLRGEGTLETDAMAGMALFQEHCSGCHSGGHLSDFSFESNGLPTNSDYGRTLITLNPADSGKFKVPALRGVAATAPYMHDGSYATLDSVVRSYNIWHGLALSEEEIDQLTSFLNQLGQ